MGNKSENAPGSQQRHFGGGQLSCTLEEHDPPECDPTRTVFRRGLEAFDREGGRRCPLVEAPVAIRLSIICGFIHDGLPQLPPGGRRGYFLDKSAAHRRHSRSRLSLRSFPGSEAASQLSPVLPQAPKDGPELAGPRLHGRVLPGGPGHRHLGLQEGQAGGEEVHGEHQRGDHGRGAEPERLRQHLHHDGHVGRGRIHRGVRRSRLQPQERAGLGFGALRLRR